MERKKMFHVKHRFRDKGFADLCQCAEPDLPGNFFLSVICQFCTIAKR